MITGYKYEEDPKKRHRKEKLDAEAIFHTPLE